MGHTVKAELGNQGMDGRGPLPSKVNPAARLIGTTAYCERCYLPPRAPVIGSFVRIDNGWGERIRGKILVVSDDELGLALHDHGGPFFWAKLSDRGNTWDFEG